MTATVHIEMKATIKGKVYTAKGAVEVEESYFSEFPMVEWLAAARAAELAEILQGKIQEGDYSFLAE